VGRRAPPSRRGAREAAAGARQAEATRCSNRGATSAGGAKRTARGGRGARAASAHRSSMELDSGASSAPEESPLSLQAAAPLLDRRGRRGDGAAAAPAGNRSGARKGAGKAAREVCPAVPKGKQRTGAVRGSAVADAGQQRRGKLQPPAALHTHSVTRSMSTEPMVGVTHSSGAGAVDAVAPAPGPDPRRRGLFASFTSLFALVLGGQ
jgi:hypothetical protein